MALHLDQLDAGHALDEVARGDVDVVVTTEVAGVVVGDLLLDTRLRWSDGRKAPLLHEGGEELRVVHDLIVATDLRVFAPKGVEAVRAGDDDLLGLDLVEDLDILHRLHLEEELIARAACGITVAGLALAKHHEVDAGDGEQLGYRLGRGLGAVLEGAGAADPEEVFDVVGDLLLAVHAEDTDLEVDLLDPRVAT